MVWTGESETEYWTAWTLSLGVWEACSWAAVAAGEDTTWEWWASVAERRRRADHGVVAFVGVVSSGPGSMDVWEHGTAGGSSVGMRDTIAEDIAGKEASSAPWAAGSMQDIQDADSSEAADVHIACHACLDEAAWECVARRHRAFADSFFRTAEQARQVGDCLSTSTRTT